MFPFSNKQQEESKGKDESGNEDGEEDGEEEINGKTGEDVDKGEDVIRSVQSVKGKSSKLPSNEEFWGEESQPSSTSSSSGSSFTFVNSIRVIMASNG